MENTLPVNPAEGVGAEAVALGLEQVKGTGRVAQAVKVIQAGGDGGNGYPVLGGGGSHAAPVILVVQQGVSKIGIQ